MNTSYQKFRKRHVKGEYSHWRLVKLASGRWSPVFRAFLELEGAFTAIVNEDQRWFSNQITFVPPPRYDTKEEALEKIDSYLEKEKTRSEKFSYCQSKIDAKWRRILSEQTQPAPGRSVDLTGSQSDDITNR